MEDWLNEKKNELLPRPPRTEGESACMSEGRPMLHAVAPSCLNSARTAEALTAEALTAEALSANALGSVASTAEPANSEPLDAASLFRRYSPYVAAVAYRLLGRDDEVDDAVQEVFMAAVRGVGTIRDAGAVKGWLARIAVRVAHRRLTLRRWRGRFGLDNSDGYERVADDSASPEDRALLSRVYQLLDQLPPGERLAWTLRHVEGEPLDTVATLCGCSLATAKRRITSAAQHLEKALHDA